MSEERQDTAGMGKEKGQERQKGLVLGPFRGPIGDAPTFKAPSEIIAYKFNRFAKRASEILRERTVEEEEIHRSAGRTTNRSKLAADARKETLRRIEAEFQAFLFGCRR